MVKKIQCHHLKTIQLTNKKQHQRRKLSCITLGLWTSGVNTQWGLLARTFKTLQKSLFQHHENHHSVFWEPGGFVCTKPQHMWEHGSHRGLWHISYARLATPHRFLLSVSSAARRERSWIHRAALQHQAMSKWTHQGCTETDTSLGGFCFGIWRRVTLFCCVLKAFCKRTFRCRGSCLCPPPQVPMPGVVFVLQCLLGMCWTWDRAKTGRKSWEILRGHNVGLKSWEIPPVNKRPRSTSYHNEFSLNQSTAWPRSKHPHGTTQEAWWMFHPTQAPKKPPQPKAVAPAWHRQVINPVLRDARSVCAKQELGLAPARIF